MRKLALLLILIATTAATAPNWVLRDRAYRSFLGHLQTAVEHDDRQTVLGLVALPLRVNRQGHGTTLYRTRTAISKDYVRIFTPNVRGAILAQHFTELFGRDQGVMIGDGQVWFDHACADADCRAKGSVRIIAVNP